MSTEFRVLGPLEALVGDRPVPLGGPRQRAVLALLLARAGDAVPVERLIDGVWDDEPPGTAVNLVQGYVSQLRKALGKNTIVTRGPGYAAIVAAGCLDLERFERLLAAAAIDKAGGDQRGGGAKLKEALSLWRGPALADVAGLPAIALIAARLDELRLLALERRIEADIDTGLAAEAAAELEGVIADHPLRERTRALRMRALYRAGRQADALEEFREAREILVGELGIEPGSELSELQRAILSQDPSLAAGGADSSPPHPGHRPRAILAAALSAGAATALAQLGAALGERAGDEVVLAGTVPTAAELAVASAHLQRTAAGFEAAIVTMRTGVFTSLAPGADLSRFATEQDVDLLLVDAPDGLLEDLRVITLLEDSPCDVAVMVGDGSIGPGPVLVPFSGLEHDWAAVELGAWLARSTDRPLRLAGPSTGSSGRDASRLLASASLALQRATGVRSEPVIVDPAPAALVAAAGAAGVVVVGLTDRWQREGLGRVRTALATESGRTTLLTRRGLRPGGLAPGAGDTRFTWTVAVGG